MAAKIISLWIDAGWRSLVYVQSSPFAFFASCPLSPCVLLNCLLFELSRFCNNITRATSLLAFMQDDKRFSSYACKVRTYYASIPTQQKVQELLAQAAHTHLGQPMTVFASSLSSYSGLGARTGASEIGLHSMRHQHQRS